MRMEKLIMLFAALYLALRHARLSPGEIALLSTTILLPLAYRLAWRRGR